MTALYESDDIEKHDSAYYCDEQWKIQEELTRVLSEDLSQRWEQAERAWRCFLDSLTEPIPAITQLDR